jgi:hypothetical protein
MPRRQRRCLGQWLEDQRQSRLDFSMSLDLPMGAVIKNVAETPAASINILKINT